MNIFLTGFKASGKSVLGKALAEHLQRRFYDTDTLTEEHYAAEKGENLTCREIFTKEGESAFRDREHKAIDSLKLTDNVVVATGGGLVIRPANRVLLQKLGLVVFLNTSLPIIEARVGAVDSPLFKEHDWQTLYENRYPFYTASAHTTFTITEECPPQELVQRLVKQLAEENHVI